MVKIFQGSKNGKIIWSECSIGISKKVLFGQLNPVSLSKGMYIFNDLSCFLRKAKSFETPYFFQTELTPLISFQKL